MKPIVITEDDKKKMLDEFAKSLETLRLADGVFTFSRSFASRPAEKDERATVNYTPEAYLKMLLLVNKFDSEVGWHGLIKKIGDRTWLVYDVLVYPQEVTGSTVETSYEGEDSYPIFLRDLTQEQSEDMFFHGHSHVNMAVSPSTTDMKHRADLMQGVEPDRTWIFQIWNKRGEISTAIYDIASNVMYETKDIDLNVLFEYGSTGDTYNSADFIYDATSHVKKLIQKTVAKPVRVKKSEKRKTYDYDDDLLYDGTAPYGKGYDYGGYYA